MDKAAACFIIIDDNKIDCFIAQKILENSGKDFTCHVFHEADKALEYIKDAPEEGPVIVFVDIQMPMMNGFEFVGRFERLCMAHHQIYHIYVLSSSINEVDKEKIKSFPSVKGFLNKPLTAKVIDEVVKAASL